MAGFDFGYQCRVRTPPAAWTRRPSEGYRHEALFYSGRQGFLDGTVPFIRDGLEAGEPVLAAVDAAKIELLRSELGGDADRVSFADMAQLGANPAWILPAWRDFVNRHSSPGRGMRGIGEPIGPGRAPAELVECHRHESLLNLAFAETPGFWLLCPYDVDGLDQAVLDEARRTHPFVTDDGASGYSMSYRGLEAIAGPFTDPLPDPPPGAVELAFGAHDLAAARASVAQIAAGAGTDPARTAELVLAVSEVASNSVRHGGGDGVLRVWQEGDALICEVRDRGRIDDPLVGRQRPAPDQQNRFGLWLATQLCELVQVRSLAAGNVIRLHVRVSARPG